MRDLEIGLELDLRSCPENGQRLEERRRRPVQGDRVVRDARGGVAGGAGIDRRRRRVVGVRRAAVGGELGEHAARIDRRGHAVVVMMMVTLVDERVVVVIVVAVVAVAVVAVAVVVVAVDDRAVGGVRVVRVVGREVEVREDLDAEEPEHARRHRYIAAAAALARLPPGHERRWYDATRAPDRRVPPRGSTHGGTGWRLASADDTISVLSGGCMKLAWLAALLALPGAAACGDDPSRCDEPGRACTWAGRPGVFGFNGDGHHRLDTELYWTMDLSFAADGTVWLIDWNNHLIRRILTDDTVTTVVGWTDPIFPGDGLSGGAERTAEGAPGTDVQLNHPTDLAQTADGKVLVMAWHNHKLREIDPATGRVRIVAGAGAGYSGDGATTATALFKQPKGLELDPDGNMYILDQQNFRIRKIERATGAMSVIAGNGMQGSDGDGGPALAARLNFEAGSNPEPSGGLVFAGNKLYVADTLSSRIRAIDLATGMISTVAGTGVPGYSGDGGPALAAQLNFPRDLEIGPDGHLYIADTDNSVIRAIDLATGTIRTVAGTGEIGLDPDDDRPALETKLARPFGIEFDPAGALYISDTINSRIVRVAR